MTKKQEEIKEDVSDKIEENKEVTETKEENQVDKNKGEITDEKGTASENEEPVNEAKDKTTSKPTIYTLKVDKPFTDKDDRSIKYKVGDTFATDDKKRVKDLTKRGLAHVIK